MDQDGTRTILLVEDEHMTALLEGKILKDLGYAVVTAGTGEKAVELAATLPRLDLVLMDIDLGEGMDGTQAAERILAERDIPVLFLSSHTEPAIVAKTERVTSYGYVVKDSAPTVLDASIKMAFKLFNEKRTAHENHETLELILNTVPQSIFWKDLEGRYLGCNHVFADAIGLADPAFVIGLTDYDLPWPREEAEAYRADDREVIEANKGKLHIIEPLQEADGTRRWIDTSKMPLRGRDGRPYGILGIYYDITEHRRREEELKETRLLLETTERLCKAGGWALDLKSQTISWTAGTYALHGYSEAEAGDAPAERIERSLERYDPADRDSLREKLMDCVSRGESYSLECPFTTIDGRRLWIRTEARAVRGPDGSVTAVEGNIMDLTERRRAEEEIERQLAEKELLLREVHHRIKNNVASIEALLSMQARETKVPEARAALQDAIGRVESMRALYETLLSGGGEGSARDYVEEVTRSAVALYPEAGAVELALEAEDFTLPPRTLFSLGIIANELITNIMKYAFAGRSRGLVTVGLTREGRKARLVVHDDGVGLPEGFDPGKSAGFGLTLVGMLADQLGGSFSIGNCGGTRSVVEFDA